MNDTLTTTEQEYNVNLYVTVRVKVSGVTAEAARQAAEKAYDTLSSDTDFRARCENLVEGEESEFSEELTFAVVDVVGDTEYQLTKHIDMTKGDDEGRNYTAEAEAAAKHARLCKN